MSNRLKEFQINQRKEILNHGKMLNDELKKCLFHVYIHVFQEWFLTSKSFPSNKAML